MSETYERWLTRLARRRFLHWAFAGDEITARNRRPLPAWTIRAAWSTFPPPDAAHAAPDESEAR